MPADLTVRSEMYRLRNEDVTAFLMAQPHVKGSLQYDGGRWHWQGPCAISASAIGACELSMRAGPS